MKQTKAIASSENDQTKNTSSGGLLQRANRGMLLDICVFVFNLLLMRFLLPRFAGTISQAVNGDFAAQVLIFSMLAAMLVLPPIAAILKRWHFHTARAAAGDDVAFGCLFNPILYFCLIFTIFAFVQVFLLQYIYGDEDPGAWPFLLTMLVGTTLTITHTWLVYRYFSPPKNPQPKFAFLLDPRSDLIGDICIWVNVLFFQMFWNYAFRRSFVRPGDAEELIGRIFVFGFIALLVYFPPRIFYLAEDIGRRRVWLTILLANSPILFRVLIGTSPDGGW
jgi:hypothetical protein